MPARAVRSSSGDRFELRELLALLDDVVACHDAALERDDGAGVSLGVPLEVVAGRPAAGQRRRDAMDRHRAPAVLPRLGRGGAHDRVVAPESTLGLCDERGHAVAHEPAHTRRSAWRSVLAGDAACIPERALPRPRPALGINHLLEGHLAAGSDHDARTPGGRLEPAVQTLAETRPVQRAVEAGRDMDELTVAGRG
jgi:hypothetical protein